MSDLRSGTSSGGDNYVLAGTLTASLAHDLRNVLAIVRTAAQLAEQPERTARELAKIARNADRGLAMVEVVLALIRGETLATEPTDLLRAVREATDEHDGRLAFVLLEEEAPVVARSVAPLVTSAFAILFDNAANVGAQTVYVQFASTETAFEITVHDDGPGIEGDATTLFAEPGTSPDSAPSEPMSGAREPAKRVLRSPASDKRIHASTGLGLWFARYALARVGATLALVAPVPATFRITFPRGT